MIMSSKISLRRIRDNITYDHMIVLPKDAAYNIERINKARDAFLDIAGCPMCHSGHDILFKDHLSLILDIQTMFRNDYIITKDNQLRPLSEAFSITL